MGPASHACGDAKTSALLTSLRSFSAASRVLRREAVVQRQEPDVRDNFLKSETNWFTPQHLYSLRENHQLGLGCLQQNGSILDGSGGQGVEAARTQYFSQKRAHIQRGIDAKKARSGVSTLTRE